MSKVMGSRCLDFTKTLKFYRPYFYGYLGLLVPCLLEEIALLIAYPTDLDDQKLSSGI